MTKRTRLHKILNWEYWHAAMFYIPNLPYAFYLAIRARHLTFFTAANPAIKSSGNGTESKFEVLQLVPKQFRPKTILVNPNTHFNEILKTLEKKGITFPLIAKPDVGFRGLLVQKINTENQLKNYLQKYPIKIILQEFLNHENECGIFYYRMPSEPRGKISSITLKKFLSVKGDGKTTLKQLILNDNRSKLYYNLLFNIHQKNLDKIISKNKKIKLSVIGNHSKGTQFINGNYLISEKLEKTFDALSISINGFFYGRIDLKYNSFKDLENNSNFKIVEINGILAEPTHMYDPKSSSYFKALQTIRSHWKVLFKIATINNKKFNTPYKTPYIFIKEILKLNRYSKKVRKISQEK